MRPTRIGPAFRKKKGIMTSRSWLYAAILMTTGTALAEAPAAAPGGGLTQLVPVALMFGIFYFLLIRPQQKKQKLHEKFLSELKKGDMVVTNAGIVGVIRTISDKLVKLEVDNNVCLKVLRAQILDSAASLKEEAKES